MQKRISIAIATYNGSEFLREQLDSLCSQTLLPDEIVAADDCSTDNTMDILLEYQEKLNISILKSDCNLGVNKNFERAIKACRGDYVMICDQDDVWLPDKVETMYRYMLAQETIKTESTPILVSSDFIPFSKSSDIVLSIKPCQGTLDYYLDFLFSSNLHNWGCTMMMNRAFISILPPFPNLFYQFGYDEYIAHIATIYCHRCHINQTLMYYRHHTNNVVSRITKPTLRLKWYLFKQQAFTFFGIIYKRQRRYAEFLQYGPLAIEDQRIRNDVEIISRFVTANGLVKIKTIMATRSLPVSRRIGQLFFFLATSPIRWCYTHRVKTQYLNNYAINRENEERVL